MDTIVRLCYQTEPQTSGAHRHRRKPECTCHLEAVPLQDYRLIRVTICGPLPETAGKRERGPGEGFWRGGNVRRSDRSRKRCRAELQAALCGELAPLLDDYGDNYLVFGDNLPPKQFGGLLPLPEFDAYDNPKWIRRLLVHAVHPDFIVLGDIPCLQALLCELAPRMKTLCWLAPDLTAREQMEDFAEDFYQEYGLAINLQFVPDGNTYGRMCIPAQQFRTPVNVLDFTGEKYLPAFCPPEGSVWLDFASLPEKERRIEARRLKVSYLSLQKQWRKSPSVLDTAGKNRYNT